MLVSVLAEHNQRHQSPGPERGIWFDEPLAIFVTQDHEIIAEILRSPDWVVAYREPVDRILGDTTLSAAISYDATSFAFDNLPLANEWARHRALRRAFALRLAERKQEIEEALPSLLATLIERALSKTRAELVGELVLPMVRHILRAYGAPDDVDGSVSVSQVLDPLISLGRRQRIEDSLKQMRIDLAAGDDHSEAEIGQGLSFQILGGDSLAGSMSASLFAVLEAHNGTRLSDVAWPRHITGTGVPYIARRCTKPVRVGNYAFEEGAFIRLYLRQFANLDQEASSDAVFGVGKHVCPGKNISLRIWAALSEALAQRAEALTVVSHKWRPSDYVFDHLDELLVEIHG